MSLRRTARAERIDVPHPDALSPPPPAKVATSKFWGVSRCNKTHKFKSVITVKNRQYFLGYYESEVEAARIYDEASIKYRGPDARRNFASRQSDGLQPRPTEPAEHASAVSERDDVAPLQILVTAAAPPVPPARSPPTLLFANAPALELIAGPSGGGGGGGGGGGDVDDAKDADDQGLLLRTLSVFRVSAHHQRPPSAQDGARGDSPLFSPASSFRVCEHTDRLSPQLLERLDDVGGNVLEAHPPAASALASMATAPTAPLTNGKRARTLSLHARAQSPALERWGSPATLSMADSHVSLPLLAVVDNAAMSEDFFIN